MKQWLIDHAVSLGGTILAALVLAAGKKLGLGLDDATAGRVAAAIMGFVLTHGFHQALDNHAEKMADQKGDAK